MSEKLGRVGLGHCPPVKSSSLAVLDNTHDRTGAIARCDNVGLATRGFCAGYPDSGTLVGRRVRKRELRKCDHHRHRERSFPPSRDDRPAASATRLGPDRRASPLPNGEIDYAIQINNVMINGQSQSMSYTTTAFDPHTTAVSQPVSASIEFLQPAAQVSASAGSLVIEVARGMNASQQVSVDYSTSDSSARAGADYVSTSGVLTFAPGQFYQQITIPVLPGSAQDPGEPFRSTYHHRAARP